ncbi:MAG: hypothetical protein AVDCRST_MAG19-2698, partial [uncultured Thermomicrobiales bacterium]
AAEPLAAPRERRRGRAARHHPIRHRRLPPGPRHRRLDPHQPQRRPHPGPGGASWRSGRRLPRRTPRGSHRM